MGRYLFVNGALFRILGDFMQRRSIMRAGGISRCVPGFRGLHAGHVREIMACGRS